MKPTRLLHVLNATRLTVQNNVKIKQAKTLNKSARSRFTTNNMYLSGIDVQWQADLANMQGIAEKSGEIKYLLTVIDVFSKFVLAVPIYSTDAKAITTAFGQVLTASLLRHAWRLKTDNVTELCNLDYAALLNRHGI